MEVHATALVDSGARLGRGVRIGPYAVIESDVELGDGCQVGSHAVIKRFSQLGENNIVDEGAILGGEPQDVSFDGARSCLRIGDRNRFREGVTISRGSRDGSSTVIGNDCYLMGFSHVGHDVVMGDGVVMANYTGLSGWATVGDQAFLSGGVVVHQFVRIGRLAMIGAHAKVVQDCVPFVIADGIPARARGLNVVGLRRAAVAPAQRRLLAQAYRLLVRSGLPLAVALERMSALSDPLVAELVEFVRASKRGFGHPTRRPA